MDAHSPQLAPPSKTRDLIDLWNELEIRVLVMSSLGIQILLLCLAGFRKHFISSRWATSTTFSLTGPLYHMFHWLLWSAYLLADYVATVALAYLPNSELNKKKETQHLLMFWAPFFLLHLGGQDTITALSVEDNELWARHLLTLLSQVALAGYHYISVNWKVGDLWPPAAIMFTVALFKYAERIYSLQRASMSALRSSMITKPDPGPNYAKFMQQYTSSRAAGLRAEIIVEVEKHEDDLKRQQTKESAQSKPADSEEVKNYLESEQTTISAQNTGELKNQGDPESPQTKKSKCIILRGWKPISMDAKTKEYADIVYQAYKFFPTFKRLFVDLILTYKDREESQKHFEGLKFEQAYKLIEVELSWMYDILHSKSSLIFAWKPYGWVSRIFTLVLTTTALVLFAVLHPSGYRKFEFEIVLTYVLLGGAVCLEIIAFAFMLLSFWTYALIRDSGCCRSLEDFLFHIQKRIRRMEKPRWSDKMAQYSLITYSFHNQPSWWKFGIISGVIETWNHYRYTTYAPVSKHLKAKVFDKLKDKMKSIEDRTSYKRITEHKGQWALQRMGYYHVFGWAVEVEFDESILLWHIATDLLYQETEEEGTPNNEKKEEHTPNNDREISQNISNYMLFLLIVRPFMMPAGIGQIRFGDTCAEASIFLQLAVDIKDCAEKILNVSTEHDPGDVKGDRSKSVLFTGCKLAHLLKKEFIDGDEKKGTEDQKEEKKEKKNDWDGMWRLISAVWVEMLCYAASKCSGQYHAKQLSKGGELLTVVWFLMAHLGMGEQYRIEEGHARAKLIVYK
ncbi:hypothetical protein LUZ63_000628 [Rhynchospora breviuscula]|uniref:DUF4220 domain-containing protein n=1 Tax=Rhynchospora breviuscula TaxID=2022672 RepID=A0A9Q0CWP3_9POAL|nr:hypothetical protein LUZ63_000628 [Rhynchospora breviuscula]